MINSNLKISLCRTCLTEHLQNSAHNIFKTQDLAQKLMVCVGQPVETTDEYPENVCLKCYDQIIMFFEFQQMCCKSLDTFCEIIKSREILKEESSKINIQTAPAPAEDPLNVDDKVSSPLNEISMELLDNTEILKDILVKKKRSCTSKIKLPQRVSKRKKNNTKSSREVGIGEEYLLFETEAEACLANEENDTLHERSSVNTMEKALTDAKNSCSSQEQVPQTQNHQCDFCSKRFKSMERLKAHIRQHDGLSPYVCTFEGCESSFDSWYFYNKHQRDHNLITEESFQCDVDNCKRKYKSKTNLNVHKRKFHNLGPQLKTHMCEVCGKVFKSSAVLNDHQYIHIDKTQLPYACEEKGCSKRFSNREKLKIHKMRHAGIKNFICPYCSMRKTTRNELKIHINYHTLERTYPCRFCPKVCNSAGNLKMHVRNIHERAKDFACSYCDRTFAKADTKKYHEMTHTGEKPHECKECGRRFLQPAALRTHRKIHLRQMAKLTENQNSEEPSPVVEVLAAEENTNEENFLIESIEG